MPGYCEIKTIYDYKQSENYTWNSDDPTSNTMTTQFFFAKCLNALNNKLMDNADWFTISFLLRWKLLRHLQSFHFLRIIRKYNDTWSIKETRSQVNESIWYFNPLQSFSRVVLSFKYVILTLYQFCASKQHNCPLVCNHINFFYKCILNDVHFQFRINNSE